ncbi:dehydrogenase [Nocardia cyriacigeorgica]|uniref:Dehydrogenase n=1 Tax=Nocardia cyriacigeorgica TaxID=135487 RepID=A0A6P1DBS0_9NOCA|nr:nitroreductase family protein [Nocardia cyriacigeorgica]NEW39161.1 dehydrogenase [Nocardia cyriacigeorgica]NEW48186.1 dehydrogenase [Nocardia cyriacigeorgica]NEW53488.1 dehydrogenase [Nocardia cyriacigeorgica]NEW56895.1 dehydrogenase [Nocardia cyriacigeorgica]
MNKQPLSVPEAIRTRRTVRHYRPEPVPQPLLDELLDLVIEAPTAWNMQDRSIVLVTSESTRNELSAAAFGQPQPREAPVVLVFVAETAAWESRNTDIAETATANGAWNAEFRTMFESRAEFHDLDRRGLIRENSVKNAMIAAGYAMLAATSLGLASAPMNGWDPDLVKKAIGIEARPDLAIAVLVTLGYAAAQPPHPGRRHRDRIVFPERYPATS